MLLFSTAAHADGVLRGYNAGDMIVFKNTPCTNAAVLSFIEPEFYEYFKQAGVKVGDDLVAACWAVSPEDKDVVYIMTAEGEGGVLPFKAITFDLGA